MKSRKVILPIIILILFYVLYPDKKSEKIIEKDFTITELLGTWNRIESKESLKDKNPKIESIQFVNDSVAEIKLIDSNEKRIVIGKWKKEFEKDYKKINLEVKSDIQIIYYPKKNHKVVLLLKTTEENKKAIITGYKMKFEKE